MRPSLLLVTVLAATSAHASWFGSDKPDYQTWDEAQLKAWLQSHNIEPPETYSSTQLQDLVKSNWDKANAWTADQYARAQKAFANVKDDTFAAWDESQLRQFLLDQGVVEPKGTREQLAVLARQKYNAYTSYASALSSTLSSKASTAVYGDPTSQASKSVTSAASVVSASASSVYTEASSTVSSVVAQATEQIGRVADDAKDYVYSSWDESDLRQYLQDKGLVEPHAQTTKEQLLVKMKTAYLKSTDPIWNAWTDSYIREWLISHDLIHSSNPETDTEEFRHALAENLTRESLVAKMQHYYYDTKGYIWSSWTDSELHDWLVSHGIIKSEARIQRDKLVKMVGDNYASAQDTIWGAWSDSQMHDWLVEHGYLSTDAQQTRDQLIKLMNAKYDDASAKTASYLVWPDARLRAYLRNRGVSEDAIPTTRPSLLQEVRIRWIQTTTRAESVIARISDIINSNLHLAEHKIGDILALLTGQARSAEDTARASYYDAKGYAQEKAHDAQWAAESAGYEGKAQWKDAKGTAKSAAAQASGNARATKEWAQGKAESATAEAEKATARVKHEL